MGQAASSNDMISRPLEACMMEPRPIISRHERGLKYGYVTVKVSSLVPNRGQTDRGTSHIVYPKGAIFHGSNGAPDAVIGGMGLVYMYIYKHRCIIKFFICVCFTALSAQNGSTCSLPERVLLQDSRVHDLLVMHTQGWHIFPSPEVFSRHSGTCLVVGDRTFQHPPVPIKLGDCFRLGSVGIVVSEYKTADGVEERLDSKALQYLRDEAVAFDIAEEEACLAADEGGFDVDCPEEDVLSQGTHQEVEDALRSSKKSGNLKQVDECATINDDGYESGGDAEDGHGGKSSSRSVTPERRPTVSKYFCYMCYESHDTVDDPLVAPCQCRGDTRYLHVQCLQKWYQSTGNGVHAQVIRTTGNGAPACKICGGAYKTVFRNAEGKKVSLLEMNTDGPYVTLIVVTKHDTNASLFNTRFRLNFSSDFANAFDDNPNSPVSINIGRSSSCNMIVDYRTVSTRHARIFYENGQFMLQDQRSSNGTMVYLRDAIKLSYNRPVRLRMGRSTLSIEASTLTSRDSLFHPQEGRLSAAFCCGSTSAVDATANHSIQFDGSDILNEDSDEEVVQSSQEGPVSSMLTRLHLKKPPPSPEKIEKLPPLANLAPSDVYNTLVEVSRRPQAASMSGSRRGGNGTNVVSPRGNGSPGINDDPLDQSPRGSRHRNSRRLERLTQVANAELDLLSEEAQVQALLEEAIMSGSFRNANMLANDALPENHVSNRSIVVRSTSEASNQNVSCNYI